MQELCPPLGITFWIPNIILLYPTSIIINRFFDRSTLIRWLRNSNISPIKKSISKLSEVITKSTSYSHKIKEFRN